MSISIPQHNSSQPLQVATSSPNNPKLLSTSPLTISPIQSNQTSSSSNPTSVNPSGTAVGSSLINSDPLQEQFDNLVNTRSPHNLTDNSSANNNTNNKMIDAIQFTSDYSKIKGINNNSPMASLAAAANLVFNPRNLNDSFETDENKQRNHQQQQKQQSQKNPTFTLTNLSAAASAAFEMFNYDSKTNDDSQMDNDEDTNNTSTSNNNINNNNVSCGNLVKTAKKSEKKFLSGELSKKEGLHKKKDSHRKKEINSAIKTFVGQSFSPQSALFDLNNNNSSNADDIALGTFLILFFKIQFGIRSLKLSQNLLIFFSYKKDSLSENNFLIKFSEVFFFLFIY